MEESYDIEYLKQNAEEELMAGTIFNNCKGCEYVDVDMSEDPCNHCTRQYKVRDHYIHLKVKVKKEYTRYCNLFLKNGAVTVSKTEYLNSEDAFRAFKDAAGINTYYKVAYRDTIKYEVEE